MIKVYQLKDGLREANDREHFEITFRGNLELIKDAFHRDYYVAVAEVDTDDLESAFELTNTVHQVWWANTGVKPLFTGEGCRSSSVGDVFERNGKLYAVGKIGFEELPE